MPSEIFERLGLRPIVNGVGYAQCLLRLDRGQFPLVDVEHQTRIAPERLTPVSVCKRGQWSPCGKES